MKRRGRGGKITYMGGGGGSARGLLNVDLIGYGFHEHVGKG